MRISTKLLFAVAFTLALVAGARQAWVQDQSESERKCEALFKTLDSDHSNQVSVEEFVVGSGGKTYATRKVLKERFLALDLDGNEMITRREFCVPSVSAEKLPEEHCADRFVKMDTDKSGKLSVTELIIGEEAQTYGARKVAQDTLVMKDLDGDQMLTQEEFCKDE